MKDFAKELWSEVQDDHVLDGAAVIAFFSLLAIFPAVLFVLSLLPSLNVPHLEQAVVDLMHQVLPAQSADLFEFTVRYVGGEGKKGLLTFGLVLSLWSASSGISALMDQLNVVWDVRERRPLWKAKGIAILLVLFFVALAIGSLSLVVFGGTIQAWVASLIGWSEPLRIFFASYRWIVLAVTLLLGLAVAYRYGPDVEGRLQFFSPGTVSAAVLIALASLIFRIYVVNFSNYSATYGNLAAMIILMMWMYMAGIALLVGCEVNRILERHKRERAEMNECGA
ncbi:MAG TPA: YihY/virulence factor BrkB family protein [Terracidiphilus sp.]|nr:YihY/virulence factor BrkB family protein [Terracidiphilus sp.]